MAQNKYLTETEINNLLGIITVNIDFQLMSQDSYNETLIAQKIKGTNQAKALLQCTINLAIVGFGNKKLGSYREGEKIIEIAAIFKSCDVKLHNPANAQLKEDELTPQRLCRFFRYHIRKYIQDHNVTSYLYRKYTDHNVQFLDICFRGAEYLDDLKDDEYDYLLKAITNLDQTLGTNIQQRVIRVHQAKKGSTYKNIKK